MRGNGARQGGSAVTRHQRLPFPLIVCVISALLAAVGSCVSPRALAADGGSGASRRIVLSAQDLDRVTAGSTESLDRATAGTPSIQIDADASAHGATAAAGALTTFETDYGQALMVHVDPPEDHRPPRMMGTQELAITHGSGRAAAAGDQGADCAVNATVTKTPDVVASMVASDKVTTATTALCQCSLLAVTVVH